MAKAHGAGARCVEAPSEGRRKCGMGGLGRPVLMGRG